MKSRNTKANSESAQLQADGEADRLANAALWMLLSCAACGGGPYITPISAPFRSPNWYRDGSNPNWYCFGCWPCADGDNGYVALQPNGTIYGKAGIL